ncbi:hypothetical protein DIPPA_70136 [Diplonema papillatum]|nr:hypothetical protein DIPPA_70136 [Diplonema papillatum]
MRRSLVRRCQFDHDEFLGFSAPPLSPASRKVAFPSPGQAVNGNQQFLKQLQKRYPSAFASAPSVSEVGPQKAAERLQEQRLQSSNAGLEAELLRAVHDEDVEHGRAAWVEATNKKEKKSCITSVCCEHAMRLASLSGDLQFAYQIMKVSRSLGFQPSQALLRPLRATHVKAGDAEGAAEVLRKLAPFPHKQRPLPSGFRAARMRSAHYGENTDWWSIIRDNKGGLSGSPTSTARS